MTNTKYGNDLKEKILDGVQNLSLAVTSTLGPGGRNVLIDDNGLIKITKDGVTVAQAFSKLKDPIENLGAQIVKQASLQAADKAGDGTTTATLLAAVMIEEGFKLIQSKINPIEVKKGIDLAVSAAVKHLRSISQEVTADDEDKNKINQIKQVALVSSNNDAEIATLIAEAIDLTGNDGVVTVHETKSNETNLEEVKGLQFERGYKSPFFVTNNDTMQAVLEKPVVLITDERITSAKQILKLLEYCSVKNQPILIIAEDVEGEALATLIVNKGRGTIKVAAVKAPGYGDKRGEMLEDIAVLTGGTFLSSKVHKLEKINFAETKYLGKARLITIDKEATTIIDGDCTEESIATRVLHLKTQSDNSKSSYDRETLQERIAKLVGGVAIINVGANSELELKEKKDRIDDALHATKAAIQEGIVPGGGMALIDCIKAINLDEYKNPNEKLGAQIVIEALYAPFKKILLNAGIENHYKILSEILAANGVWYGYNVNTFKVENFFETGVLDPTKVTRIALENAASVAGTLLTADTGIYQEVLEKSKQNFDEYGE